MKEIPLDKEPPFPDLEPGDMVRFRHAGGAYTCEVLKVRDRNVRVSVPWRNHEEWEVRREHIKEVIKK